MTRCIGRFFTARGRRWLALAALAGALALPVTARAQVDEPIQFTTTFPFAVRNTVLPPGTYTIYPLSGDNQVVQLVGQDRSVFFVVENDMPPDVRQQAGDVVVFRKHGDTFALSEIWDAENQVGAVLPLSGPAREHVAQAIAPAIPVPALNRAR